MSTLRASFALLGTFLLIAVALVVPLLVDVELWPVPLGLHVRILEYGALLLTLTLPVWPVIAVLAGIGLAAIWWPRRTRVEGQ